jgi:hypothetical protein
VTAAVTWPGPAPLLVIAELLVGRPPDALDYGGLDLWPPMVALWLLGRPVHVGSIRYPQRVLGGHRVVRGRGGIRPDRVLDRRDDGDPRAQSCSGYRHAQCVPAGRRGHRHRGVDHPGRHRGHRRRLPLGVGMRRRVRRGGVPVRLPHVVPAAQPAPVGRHRPDTGTGNPTTSRPPLRSRAAGRHRSGRATGQVAATSARRARGSELLV